jgi:uncharacterized protein (TIGR02099 family)
MMLESKRSLNKTFLLRKVVLSAKKVGIFFLVFLMCYVTVGRLFVYVLEEKQEVFQKYVQQKFNVPLAFEHMQASWAWFSPIIDMHRVTLNPEMTMLDKETFLIDRLRVELDVVLSLWKFFPTFKNIELDGLKVSFEQTDQGQWKMLGFSGGGAIAKQNDINTRSDVTSTKSTSFSKSSEPLNDRAHALSPQIEEKRKKISALLFSHQSIALKNMSFLFKAQEQTYHVSSNQLKLNMIGDEFHLLGDLNQIDEQKVFLFLRATLKKEQAESGIFSGRIYLNIPAADFSSVLSKLTQKTKFKIEKATVGSEVWADLFQGTLRAFQGSVQLNDVQVSRKEVIPHAKETFELAGISGDFQYQKNGSNQWKFLASQLQLSDLHQVTPISKLFISANSNAKEFIFKNVKNIAFPKADAEYLVNIESVEMTPTLSRLGQFLNKEKWNDLDVVGTLNQLSLRAWFAKNKLVDFQGQANFARLGLKSEGAIPDFSGLNGEAYMTNYEASFLFSAEDFSLDLKNIMRAPLFGKKMQGGLVFQTNAQSWSLKSNEILIETEDAKAVTSFKIVKDRTQEVPHLFLLSEVYEGKASNTPKYIPAQKLPPALVTWLDAAIVDGSLYRGNFLYDGKLKKGLPIHEKTFQMLFDVKNAALNYAAPWPSLTSGDVLAMIDGPRVLMEIKSGKVLEGVVHDFKVEVTADPVAPTVLARGQIQASVPDGLMALSQGFSQMPWVHFLKEVESTGSVDLSLDLKIPLKTEKNKKPLIQAKVIAAVKEADFLLKKYQLPIKQLNGVFTYDEQKGLVAPKLQASLLGKPATAKVISLVEGKKTVGTRIQVAGDMNIAQLQAWSLNSVLSHVSGESPYQADIVLFNQPNRVKEGFVEVRSDLKGVDVAMPVPFHKSADQTREFIYRVTGEKASQHLEITYDQVMFADLFYQEGQVNAGKVLFGKRPLSPFSSGGATSDGVKIIGNIEKVNVDQWRWFLKEHERKKQENNSLQQASTQSAPETQTVQNAKKIAGVSGRNLFDLDIVKSIDLTVEEFIFDELAWFDVKFDAQHQKDWQVLIKSSDVDARVIFPESWQTDGIAIDVERYRLAKNPLINEEALKHATSTTDKPPRQEKPIHRVNPSTWVPFTLTLHHLYVDGQDWGKSTFKAEKQKDGFLLNQLELGLGAVNLKGNLSWRWNDGAPTTYFVGDVVGKDLGAIQKQWGYTPTIESESLKLEADIYWVGSPIDFKLSRGEGSANVLIQKGQLLDVDSTASSVKVVGLLNFETLLRRMQLDFRDLYKKGLSYDNISGRLLFRDGAIMTEGIKMDGPSVKLKVSGSVDLINENVNQKMALTLPLSRHLILPAAATGGLPLAATAYVLDLALGKQINKLTTLYFQLQGHWDDPKVTQINYFDFGGASQ